MGEDITRQTEDDVARVKLLRQALARGVHGFLPGQTADSESTNSLASDNPEIQKAYLEQLLECAPEALTILDRQQRVTRINGEFTRMFGFTSEEAIGQKIEELIIPADRRVETRWTRDVLGQGRKVTLETKRQRKDGTQLDVLISAAPVMVDGTVVAAYSLYRDISEHKRNENALRQSEARYRSLVESAAYGMGRLSRSGAFLDTNPALVAMLGYDSAEEVLALCPRKDVFSDPEECGRLMEDFRQGKRLRNVEVRWKRKSGRAILVRLSGCEVTQADDQQVIEFIAEDVTEHRVLENQFRQAQKMEAVGRLAGGVAHDFNNLLLIIRGYTEVLLERTDFYDPMHSKIEAIAQAAERATSLTRQLLAFSRKQLLELKLVDLNAIVKGLDRLLKPLAGESIQLNYRLAPDLGRTRADAGQIEQVIMNLVVNAKDAMPDGGRIVIETSNVVVGEEIRHEYSYFLPGSYTMLTVSDTGCGMDPETQARIFEPFFTTKEHGKGTGLGLSTVYGIIKQSRGYIFAQSAVGQGTTFRIYLPRVDDGVEVEAPIVTAKSAKGGTETVLLVEDEESVRELVKETLERKGYKVLQAEQGDVALKIAASHSGQIDILISDVVMPGMSGRDLAKKLGETHPDIKILYVSGYTEEAIIHQGVLEPGTAFLQKPFTLQALSRKVRDVLHPASGD